MKPITCNLMIFRDYDLYPYIICFEVTFLRIKNGQVQYYVPSFGNWYEQPLFVLDIQKGIKVKNILIELKEAYRLEQNALRKRMTERLNDLLKDYTAYQKEIK